MSETHQPLISKANNGRGFSYVVFLATLFLLLFVSIFILVENKSSSSSNSNSSFAQQWGKNVVTSEMGVVAADHVRCSEVGMETLKAGGHAVDAMVATMLCLGVVHQVSSGIGGGGFMTVRSAETGEAFAINFREKAPAAATQDLSEKYPPSNAYGGALAMAIPGELAGLHAAWKKYGKLPWKDLFQPAIRLARDGFAVVPYLAEHLIKEHKLIVADPGLRAVYAPEGKILRTGDICYNPVLAQTLELLSVEGPKALYNGSIGEKLIEDVRNAGGIATMEDMKNYKVKVTKALEINAMGYTILGAPPPSTGTLGISLALNILSNYKSVDDLRGLLGLHRMIEAFKHVFARLVNIGDPDFVNIDDYVSDILSKSVAATLQKKIFDNTTFDESYYLPRWSQVEDHGTTHLCIVDANRNAVSLTSSVNYYFGGAVLSPSTGIVLNNQMFDFSVPREAIPGQLPPAPANFIEPNKRPVSSMAPIIILKDNQLAGVLGASGGLKIIVAVTDVFLKHYIFGIDPLASVKLPRAYHQLEPNVVEYDNFTTYEEEHIVLSEDAKLFLEKKGHVVNPIISNPGAVIQLVVHNLEESVQSEQTKNSRKIKMGDGIFRGMLTAVCDPRKDGTPAGL